MCEMSVGSLACWSKSEIDTGQLNLIGNLCDESQFQPWTQLHLREAKSNDWVDV
jgi:hypothetical protein